MSDTTESPFNSWGLSFSWAAVWRLLGYLLPIIGVAVMLYLTSVFVTRSEMRAAVQGVETSVAPLPAKVQSLEEFRFRQEQTQARSDIKMEAVQTSLATISAQQTNTDKKLDRLLDTVERMNRRTP